LDLEKPPQHRLFDPEIIVRSPVPQRRIDAQNAKGSAGPLTAPLAPVFNITVGDGLVDLLRPAHRADPDPTPPTLAIPPPVNNMLLRTTSGIGPDMPIVEFCTSFSLQPSILVKLEENAYDYACNLRFITLDNLTEMGFKLGEKAALQDAIERWSVPLIL